MRRLSSVILYFVAFLLPRLETPKADSRSYHLFLGRPAAKKAQSEMDELHTVGLGASSFKTFRSEWPAVGSWADEL